MSATKYTADQKRELLEKFLLRLNAGQTPEAAAADLGCKAATLKYWQAIVENGGQLTDTDKGKGQNKSHLRGGIDARNKPREATKKRGPGRPAKAKAPPATNANGAPRKRGSGNDHPLEVKLAGATAVMNGMRSIDVARKYGVHKTTITKWVQDYRLGRLQSRSDQRVLHRAEPGTSIVQLDKPPPPPRQLELGRALEPVGAADELVALRAEVARLKAKLNSLLPLFAER